MKKIFLESHHIDNPFFGFGQFNYHLIKALASKERNLRLVVHGKKVDDLQQEFGDYLEYKKYYSLRRYETFRIRKRYDLWHSLNQNTRIEPYHDLPYLLTIHNITFIKDPENYKEEEVHQRFQEKIKRSNAITYISQYAKTSTHKYFDVPKVPEYVIYNGNPIKKIKNLGNFKPSVESKRPFLFSIGEFTERKNFKSLVRMLSLLPDYDLILAGKNSTTNAQEVRDLVAEKGLSERVFLPGKISEAEKQYYYQNCTAFVFPSLREGFGLPVIEAMKFAKPVFTSNNTSLPEIGGKFVFLWNSYKEEDMAEVFNEGLVTFRLKKDYYEKNLVERANSFDWSKAANDYLDVYQSLLS